MCYVVLGLICVSCSSKATINEELQTSNSAIERGSTASLRDTEQETVHVGVLSIDSAVSVNERYRPLLDYIAERLNRPVELVVLSQDTQFSEVAEGNLDFVINNPLAAVQVQRLYDTDFLVTLNRPKTGAAFSGLIIVDSRSSITSVEDLKNKRAACVDFQTAAAGCTFQIYHLLQQNFDPAEDFSSFVENRSQDNIVLAVLNGSIDVGFIRTGQLEKMVNKGMLTSTEELRIIDPQDDDFLYTHTTALYPEWPVAALSTTEPELSEQVKTVLLQIPVNHPALTKLGVESFTAPVDYSAVDSLIETLKLKSWDAETSTSP